MSNQLNVAQSIEIDVDVDELWHRTAEDYGGIHQWVSVVSDVISDPNAPDQGLGQVRTCVSPFGNTRETVVAYDEDRRVFAYAIEGMPPIVTDPVNTWTITDLGSNRSAVEMRMSGGLVPGADAAAQQELESQLEQLLGMAAEELKHYVETGEPHPRKLAAAGQPG